MDRYDLDYGSPMYHEGPSMIKESDGEYVKWTDLEVWLKSIRDECDCSADEWIFKAVNKLLTEKGE